MQYRPLGASGLQISALTLGTMTFGGQGNFAKVGDTDLAGAKRQIDMCLDAGVNLIDTADVYSTGGAEEIVGEAIQSKRDDVLLATKVRMRMGDGPNMEGLSRHHVISGCQASLRRLRTDHIDLYQVHEWDGLTPPEETLGALQYLVDQGYVRYVGVSNYAAWQLMKTLGIAERDHLPRFVSQQIYYSLQERSAEYELIPLATDQGLGTLVWSPLAGGLLSGKHRRGQDGAGGQPPARRLGRAARLRRGQALRHDRGAGRDRRGARRVGRPGGARLAADAADDQLGDHRRPHRRAAGRQPQGRRAARCQTMSWPGSRRSAARRCSIPTGTSARRLPPG